MFVEAPWITTALYFNDDIVIPTGDGTVLLGGSFERNNRDPNVEEPMKHSIQRNCTALLPSLQVHFFNPLSTSVVQSIAGR